MRKFSMTLEIPANCQCCGAALAAGDETLSPGVYRLELPEGDVATPCHIGNGARLLLARGRLTVELRARPGHNRTWELDKHFNPEAFRLVRKHWRDEASETIGSGLWDVYEFELLPFKPWYSTWCAELKFNEVDPVRRWSTGSHMPALNPARFSVKVESLG